MHRFIKILLAIFLFGILILVRAFANELFYDPLIQFFKADHSTEILPEMDSIKLVLNTALRFMINTLVSLSILWILFRKRDVIKISSLLYLVVFVLMMIAFVILINSEAAGGHLALFYVRRFLIQPIFILLLIPAFYFQKKA